MSAKDITNKFDDYVNDVYKIYTSSEYLKALKDSNYSSEEINDFLNDVKIISKDCFNYLKNQQQKYLSHVLNNEQSEVKFE